MLTEIWIFLRAFCILGILVIFITYIGFPLYLNLLRSIYTQFRKECNAGQDNELPEIQVIFSCYNEAHIIANRIDNILEQNYPATKLSVLIISDGSTDGTTGIVRRYCEHYPEINLFEVPFNVGKNKAINMAFDSGTFKRGLLCFTDADSKFAPGALASAAGFFGSSKVGLIGGKVEYWLVSASANQAEGAFWRLENFIREAEGDLGWLVSCPGQFIMMRRELFQPLPPEANTDFALPLMVLAQGYATRFDAGAQVQTLFPSDQKEVLRRRHRTVIRALTTISLYRKRLPWHLRQILFWHKTIRFYMFPVQVVVLMSNLLLMAVFPIGFWQVVGGVQLLFYSLAVAGWLAAWMHWNAPLISLPYQFSLQNAVMFGAAISYLKGKRVEKWRPPR